MLQPHTRPRSATIEERVLMTCSCRDCDALAKVDNAGQSVRRGDRLWQVMFNGLEVQYGGYYGEWMAEIIRRLRGHHEPQEELVFSRILERIGPNARMIELGCFWAFYGMWFMQAVEDGQVLLVEPDLEHLEVARINVNHNNFADRATLKRACAGFDRDYDIRIESREQTEAVSGASVATLMAEQQWDTIDLLHLDVQGAECDVIESLAQDNLKERVRFVVVSTHHYHITGDPLTHERCLSGLLDLGAHIIAEHTVDESFSGDGLIVASFSALDTDLTVDISRNRASESLFRPLAYELAEQLGQSS